MKSKISNIGLFKQTGFISILWFALFGFTSVAQSNRANLVFQVAGEEGRLVAVRTDRTLTGQDDRTQLRILQLQVGGNPLPLINLTCSGPAEVVGMAVNPDGMVLIVGIYRGHLYLNHQRLRAEAGEHSFVLTIAADGVSFRLEGLDGSTYGLPLGVSTTPEGGFRVLAWKVHPIPEGRSSVDEPRLPLLLQWHMDELGELIGVTEPGSFEMGGDLDDSRPLYLDPSGLGVPEGPFSQDLNPYIQYVTVPEDKPEDPNG